VLWRPPPIVFRDRVIKAFKRIPASSHGIEVRQLCPSATAVVERLQEAGYQAYIVGGSVRDLLLGKVPKDFDVATDATPEEVKVVFPRARLIGRRFRLAHVHHRGVLVEVATFRGQVRDAGGGRHLEDGRILRDNVYGGIEEDAVRRDFTINALFLDPVSGTIRDYVGGYKDLREGVLRLIGDPATRYREDPVRLLRAARFVAKLGVEPDHATLEPIVGMARRLEQIPPARLFEEICKLFLTGHGGATMKALQRFGLTRHVFPVLAPGDAPGQAKLDALVQHALDSTDRRIREDKSVTPAFLFAALLWQAVLARAARFRDAGRTEFQAMEQAGEEIIALQVRRAAIPRRFSIVTRQIWINQVRLSRTRGRRALRILHQPRFRAAYDFLLLRAREEPELEELVRFWTEAQKDMPPAEEQPQSSRQRPRRRPRRRRQAAAQRG